MMKKYLLPLLFAGAFLVSCNPTVETPETPDKPAVVDTYKRKAMPEWAKNAVIYEVNTRQYSKEGTLAKVREDLPRIKDLGVDILWFMPIHPIGKKKRKGTMGSYYSIVDFKAVNPDLGTTEDFKGLVDDAHKLGLKVILDWVPNHTAWDNAWITENPDWYTYDNDTITHPLDPNSGSPTGWTDVADLNYDNPDMRLAMIDALTYWVKDVGIDGYRCDVAGFVPNDFWAQASKALNAEKDVFMLAEWDNVPEHFESCFHMNYGWGYKDLIKGLSNGEKTVDDVWAYQKEQSEKYPEDAVTMYFTTNHDENSWHNFPKILGDAQKALAVMTHTFDGMPLIYSGQEGGMPDTLSFFYKDEIEWGDYKLTDFYKKLNTLKHENGALGNGIHGANPERLEVGNDKIYAAKRTKGDDTVITVINLSDKEQAYALPKGMETPPEYLSEGQGKGTLAPWGYVVMASE